MGFSSGARQLVATAGKVGGGGDGICISSAGRIGGGGDDICISTVGKVGGDGGGDDIRISAAGNVGNGNRAGCSMSTISISLCFSSKCLFWDLGTGRGAAGDGRASCVVSLR